MIDIYCDGSCLNNPGAGGWACILIEGEVIKEISNFSHKTTNNQMELKAAIEGLKLIIEEGKENYNISCYTDSKYLKDGITRWIYNWLRNDWNGGKVKNIDLWRELYLLTNTCPLLKWHWVKAHSGNLYNEMVDKLARKQASLALTSTDHNNKANVNN